MFRSLLGCWVVASAGVPVVTVLAPFASVIWFVVFGFTASGCGVDFSFVPIDPILTFFRVGAVISGEFGVVGEGGGGSVFFDGGLVAAA